MSLFSADKFQLCVRFWQLYSFNEIQKEQLAFQPCFVNHMAISIFSHFIYNSQKS